MATKTSFLRTTPTTHRHPHLPRSKSGVGSTGVRTDIGRSEEEGKEGSLNLTPTMAVACEFIDVIIPIERIDAVYPGGFRAYASDCIPSAMGRVWYDGHLLRDGAMSPGDAQHLVSFWETLGLVCIAKAEDGSSVWKDLCVVESMMGGPTLPCDWIEFDAKDRCVWMRGQDRGETVGRNESRPTPDASAGD